MFEFDPPGRLRRLADTGQLRFVYVVGVARSNSTIVCRMLGAQLDGAVYEPATPASRDIHRHYAETILRAYDAARRQIGPGRPVTLAIKDLSLFLDRKSFRFIAAHADHIVFTVRDPVSQQSSLHQQFVQEFSLGERIDAILRHPFEAFWMAWYFVVFGRRFSREASQWLGSRTASLPRLAMAGWNLKSWRRMERQLSEIGTVPVSVLDAAELRSDPDAATARLASIAAGIAPHNLRAKIEIAGHSRMLPRSKWAAEALRSSAIKPLKAPAASPAPPDAFDTALLALTGPAYRRMLAHQQNRDTATRAAE